MTTPPNDIDAIYDDFIKVIKWHINCIVPTRNFAMRERDPSYISLLLRKRNKLRIAGLIDHDDNLAVKINRCIARNRSSALVGAKNSDTRQLWALLKHTVTRGSSGHCSDKQGTERFRSKMYKHLPNPDP